MAIDNESALSDLLAIVVSYMSDGTPTRKQVCERIERERPEIIDAFMAYNRGLQERRTRVRRPNPEPWSVETSALLDEVRKAAAVVAPPVKELDWSDDAREPRTIEAIAHIMRVERKRRKRIEAIRVLADPKWKDQGPSVTVAVAESVKAVALCSPRAVVRR